MEPEIVLLRALGLLVVVPAFLLGVFWLLDRLESWILAPEDRAATVEAVLAEAERAEDVEEAVTRLLAPLDQPRPGRLGGGLRGRRHLRRRDALAEAGEALAESASNDMPAGPVEDGREAARAGDAEEDTNSSLGRSRSA